MRILAAAIDGYGCFSERNLELRPGLQILIGPNEQGKSTLRDFIGDMLYGQKRSATQRIYDENNELRCPWSKPDAYGGRLVYQLDDGRAIEIHRRFDKKNEAVQVFDRARGEDITAQFEILRNREPQFAQSHLGLSKDVFLNTATITYMTLENLGDAEALDQIRERILALADTGDERNTAEAALRRLETRLAAIGPPAARTKPLPAARARLLELNREYEQARALQQETAGIEKRRRIVLEEIRDLQERRAALESRRAALERCERAQNLREAEGLQARIDEATQQCFPLSSVRDFPLDQTHEVQNAATRVAAVRAQLEHMRAQRTLTQEQAAAEAQRLADGAGAAEDIPETYDQRLAEIATRIQRMRARLDSIEAARAAADDRRRAAEEELAAMPDFSRIVPEDPVTWLSQLASSFRAAVRAREDEWRKVELVRNQIEAMKNALGRPETLFSQCADFPAAAREYESQTQLRDEQTAQWRATIDRLHITAEHYGERIPGFAWLSVMTASLFIGLSIAAYVLGHPGIYVPMGFAFGAAAYFLGNMVYARSRSQDTLHQAERHEVELAQLRAEADERCALIDRLIVEGGCQTLRELEGKYDQYHKDAQEMESLVEAHAEQERRTDEAEQHAVEFLEHCRTTFLGMGQELQTDANIEEAAGRAMARYQVYRGAKQRAAENRAQITRHDTDARKIRDELDGALDEERTLALEVRRLMRENGYPEENKHDDALAALRSFRIRHAQVREKQGRIDVLREGAADMQRQIEVQDGELRTCMDLLSRRLAQGGCETVEQWQERAEQAKRYREIWARRVSLEEQLRGVLRGQNLDALRAAVEAEGPLPAEVPAQADAIREELKTLAEAIDARGKEEHALHLQLTERGAGVRALSEIEEDRADVESSLRALEFEREAAEYALAVIDEIARDKHSRIAPRLAAAASAFLREITGAAYEEMFISRDLHISVRIPQTQRLLAEPGKVLSKGTIDQVYLALRLAMVRQLSENGETLPLLLDDPFANYDDRRLAQALGLLSRLGAEHQILLFTCRDDVARAAQAVGAEILTI